MKEKNENFPGAPNQDEKDKKRTIELYKQSLVQDDGSDVRLKKIGTRGLEKMAAEYTQVLNRQRAEMIEEQMKGGVEKENIYNYLKKEPAELKAVKEKYPAIMDGGFIGKCIQEFEYLSRDKRKDRFNQSESVHIDMSYKQTLLFKAGKENPDSDILLDSEVGLLRKMALDYKINGGDPNQLIRLIIMRYLKNYFVSHGKPAPEQLRFVDKEKKKENMDDPQKNAFEDNEMAKEDLINEYIKKGVHPKIAERRAEEKKRLQKEAEEIKDNGREEHFEAVNSEYEDFLANLDRIVDSMLELKELDSIVSGNRS